MNEKYNQIVTEFVEHGELSNSIQLLRYGKILHETMVRLDCTLLELLGAINEAAQAQIKLYDLGCFAGRKDYFNEI